MALVHNARMADIAEVLLKESGFTVEIVVAAAESL